MGTFDDILDPGDWEEKYRRLKEKYKKTLDQASDIEEELVQRSKNDVLRDAELQETLWIIRQCHKKMPDEKWAEVEAGLEEYRKNMKEREEHVTN